MAFDMEVGLGPNHIVLDGDPALIPQRGDRAAPPIFCPFYCRQTAGWTNMPLGMEVGLSPGDFVLDGDPASPPLKGNSPPNFRPMSSPPLKGNSPPNFRPMSVMAKRLDGLRWHLV